MEDEGVGAVAVGTRCGESRVGGGGEDSSAPKRAVVRGVRTWEAASRLFLSSAMGLKPPWECFESIDF